jgi:hypothetical protein
VIDQQETIIHKLQEQVEVAQVQEPEVQQPEPKSDICMDCLYRVENCQCAEIYEPWTEAELAQQEAAKGMTESAEEVDLDPAAPHGGSDDEPEQVNPEETPAAIVETPTRPVLPDRMSMPNYMWSTSLSYYAHQLEDYCDHLETQLAERETPAAIVSGSADLEQELAETKTLLRGMTEAQDKVILRNRELEAENETLKTQLKELQAKLAQYEGMNA